MALLFAALLIGGFLVKDSITSVQLPQSHEPAQFYSNQLNDDLSKTIITSINSAQHSILLLIYSLTDPEIIASLRKKSAEGISVTVVCDAKASPYAKQKLGDKIKTRKRYSKGLMHQKILVIDQAQILIGSANMTSESLRLHGNLLTAFYCPELAQMVQENADEMFSQKGPRVLPHRSFLVGGQELEFWLLPNKATAAQHLIQLINSAQKTIRVAMFTWTRTDLAKAVIAARQRGVNVEVVIDHYSGTGASEKIVKMLRQAGIRTLLSQGYALLHHKFMYIDGSILINGSANWTKAAFTKNDDCFVILHDLTETQTENMEDLWETITAEAI